jgi:hypothetical protein
MGNLNPWFANPDKNNEFIKYEIMKKKYIPPVNVLPLQIYFVKCPVQ